MEKYGRGVRKGYRTKVRFLTLSGASSLLEPSFLSIHLIQPYRQLP